MASSKRKYLLYSSADGEAKSCAFFASAEGCRNGAACKFKHDNPATAIVNKQQDDTFSSAVQVPATTKSEKRVQASAANNVKTEKPKQTSNPTNKDKEVQLKQQEFFYADEIEKQKLELQKEYESKLKSLMHAPTQSSSSSTAHISNDSKDRCHEKRRD